MISTNKHVIAELPTAMRWHESDRVLARRRTGGRRAAEKLRKADPDFYRKIGALGGAKSRTGGFYADRELARRAGAIGGSISRRGKDKGPRVRRGRVI